MLNYLGMPPQAATHAGEIDQMISLVHWLMLVLFVGWGIYFIYVLLRFRRGANPRANYEVRTGKLSKGIEVAIVVIEMVLLVFLRDSSVGEARQQLPYRKRGSCRSCRRRAVRLERALSRDATASSDGTDINMVAADNPLGLDRRDPDAKDDITTINQLNLPVDRPVLVHLSSKDVIHSFGLYELRVKQDAVPGLSIPVWFIPNVTTNDMRTKLGKPNFDYEITCSQLCGLGHFRMRGFVTIQSAADYAAWMADQEKQLTNP
jgi:cytochrome c oxidase subunit 2